MRLTKGFCFPPQEGSVSSFSGILILRETGVLDEKYNFRIRKSNTAAKKKYFVAAGPRRVCLQTERDTLSHTISLNVGKLEHLYLTKAAVL